MRLRPDWYIASVSEAHVTLRNETQALRISSDKHRINLLTELLSSKSDQLPINPDIEPIIASLEHKGITIPQAKSTDERNNRTLEYLSCFTSEPYQLFLKLQNTKVLILGLGGTGSVSLQNLVAAGVERYALVDCDFVEESNLNRQFIYTYSDLGKRKVDVCKKYIEQRLLRSDVSITHELLRNESDFSSVIEKEAPNIALVAIDYPIETIIKTATKSLSEHHIPYIVAGVGVKECTLGRVVESGTDHRRFINTSASMATTNSISASYAAHSIIEWILDVPLQFTINKDE